MNRSSKFNFFLPQNTDPIEVNDFNSNFETIDANLLTKAQSLTEAQKEAVRANVDLNVANNLNTTAEGSVLDARQGKVIGDKLDAAVARQGSSVISSLSDLYSRTGSDTSNAYFVMLSNSLVSTLVGINRYAMAVCRDTGSYIDLIIFDSYACIHGCTVKKSDNTVEDVIHYATTTNATVTLGQGWSLTTNPVNSVVKCGKIVTLALWVAGGTITSGSWADIGTIPAGFRPLNMFDFPVLDNVSDGVIHCQITVAGVIRVYGSANIHNSIRIYTTYICA